MKHLCNINSLVGCAELILIRLKFRVADTDPDCGFWAGSEWFFISSHNPNPKSTFHCWKGKLLVLSFFLLINSLLVRSEGKKILCIFLLSVLWFFLKADTNCDISKCLIRIRIQIDIFKKVRSWVFFYKHNPQHCTAGFKAVLCNIW